MRDSKAEKLYDAQVGVVKTTDRARTCDSASSNEKDDPVVLAVDTISGLDVKWIENLNTKRQAAFQAIAKFYNDHTAIEITQLSNRKIKEFVQHLGEALFLKPLPESMLDVKFEKFDPKEGIRFGIQYHRHKQIEIIIDPGDHHVDKNVLDHKTALLSTLIHECVHGYIAAFSCDVYHDPNIAWKPCGHGNGGAPWKTTGHFFAWFYLAAGVDIALEKFLGLEHQLNLAVFQSIIVEYGGYGMPKYEAVEWKRFLRDHSWEQIDRLVGKLPPKQFERLVSYMQGQPDVAYVFQTAYADKFNVPLRC